MNRFREDTPYVFRPPKYSAFWAPLIYAMSDAFYLRRLYKVSEVAVVAGGERVVAAHRRGDSLLITPNHSDHADPHALLHLSRRTRIPLHFMAARETFDKNRGMNGAILQRVGVFSIDREGSDLKAIKEALHILAEGKRPLVLFPEGEIFHLNERLTPLNEGAATMGLRAAKRISKESPDQGAFIVPTAMKYRYVEDVSPTFPARMARLEGHLHWEPKEDLSPVARIYRFGEAYLALKEQELLGHTLEGSLTDRLERFRETLIRTEEERYFGAVSEGSHTSRVRRLRGKIRAALLGDKPLEQDGAAQCYTSLDRLYLAIQLYSYPGPYLRERPSMHRIAETLHKFEEDIFGENRIQGRRRVEVTFCEPVNLLEYMDRYAKRPKDVTTEVTTRVEDAIRNVLEEEA